MQYTINDTLIEYHAEGERVFGPNKVLLHDHNDLSSGKAWSRIGFTIETLFTKEDFEFFNLACRTLLFSLWRQSGANLPANLELHQYHKIFSNQDLHLKAVAETKQLETHLFPGGIEAIEKRISAICRESLQARNPHDGQAIFHFRVIRPQSNDNNPLHRDVWLEDYASCINLYIPLAGSNELSSLILIPESHHWPESKIERTVSGADINGIKYNVPAVTDIKGEFQIARPNPLQNQVMVFSPYLIHGGAVNLNKDQTRISIELRLWKAAH
jgi:hypothetical protein